MGIYLVLYLFAILYNAMCRTVSIKRAQAVDTALKNQRKNYVISAGIFLMIYLLLALRHPSMGNDLGYHNNYGYLAIFDRITATQWHDIFGGARFQHYEPGYVFLNKLLGVFSTNWQVFLAFMAFISLLPFHIVIKNESKNVLMSWFVFLGLPIFLLIYSGLRQTIAIGICFLAFPFIKKKKLIPALLLIVLASLFHESSLLFALSYPAYWLPIKRNARMITPVVLLCVFMFKGPLLNAIGSLLGLNIDIDNNGAFIFFAFLMMIYIFCMLLSDGEKETEGMLNILFLACFCQAFSSLNSIVARTGFYFLPILTLLLPKVLNTIKDGKMRFVLKAAVYTGFILYGLFSIQTTQWACAYPYRFFWSK